MTHALQASCESGIEHVACRQALGFAASGRNDCKWQSKVAWLLESGPVQFLYLDGNWVQVSTSSSQSWHHFQEEPSPHCMHHWCSWSAPNHVILFAFAGSLVPITPATLALCQWFLPNPLVVPPLPTPILPSWNCWPVYMCRWCYCTCTSWCPRRAYLGCRTLVFKCIQVLHTEKCFMHWSWVVLSIFHMKPEIFVPSLGLLFRLFYLSRALHGLVLVHVSQLPIGFQPHCLLYIIFPSFK